jgi:hypothetical protein
MLRHSRRLLKTLLRTNHRDFKLSVVLADTNKPIGDILCSLNKSEFITMDGLSYHLAKKNVKLLNKNKRIRTSHKYRLKSLTVNFDVKSPENQFNSALIVLEAFNRFYLVDIKEVNVEDLSEYDGLYFQYAI